MALLVRITDAQGNILREIEADPGQTIKLQPGEEQVVLPYVNPGAAEIITVGDEVRIVIDGQEVISLQNFTLSLEGETSAITFGGQDDVPDLAELKIVTDQGGDTGLESGGTGLQPHDRQWRRRPSQQHRRRSYR